MPYVHIVIVLALVQFIYFAIEVGKARAQYKVDAPATTGNEIFERHFRVQMNTLELVVVLVPGLLLFSQYLSPYVAAALGLVYLIGRMIYRTSYIKDPKSRSAGYGLSVLPVLALLGGALFGAIRAAFIP
jgi:glutathione S-transferase